ncbi:replication initiator protein A [Staphylococcus aureus]|uniref:replication initiator protein A n=1 Tax=Staphylococcus aureus TaxID=1280 RepID=UPI000FEC80C6|nr:replication initiator protein A [Staphylococcus aureus]HDJ3665873.1 replication initiator protein A [Staphylococcus aureus]HDJ6558426.1 replication initiator protein A [Staphylococcus aureus]
MSNFKRITIQEFEQERFYKLYKFLFEDEYFRKLSDSSKIAYCMFRDRFELSKMNNWIDENGNVYLIFTTKDLCELLNCGTQKVTKIKKELENFNLLEQERIGLNKPNKIYILEPKKPSKTSNNKEFRKSKFQNSENQNSRVLKIKTQEFRKSKSNDTNLSNTDYIKTKNNDMNDLNDIAAKNKISNHSNHTNQFSNNLDDKDYKEILLQEFPDQLTNYLLNYDYRDLEIIKSVILKAKKSFNSKHDDTYYMLENIEDEILISLKRVKKAIHDRGVKGQKETLSSMQGYLMKTILSELEERYSADMRRQNMAKYNIFNQ